ncbi:putative FBD-associated F-box protein [Nymphaea thermarum]|nr:putative FBD-associated F-box protein [Nymphaea thermarum]
MKGSTGYRRINELPDEILLHMLCFLPIKDAVRTSILSKRWMYLWMGIPSLVFDEKDFPLRRRPRFAEVLLSSLQSLSLFDVHSNVAHFSNMLRACPLLEKLIIRGCSAHADYVQISSKSLRTLSIKNFRFAKLEIIAPSLQTFECDCYPEHDEKCCLNVLFGDIHSIKILDVLGKPRNGAIEHPIFHELEEIIVRSCSWKLQVEYLLSLLRSSSFLRSLCIEDLSCLLYSPIDAPHGYAGDVLPCLRDLDIDCLHGNEWERRFVKHIIEGAPSLQYVRIWIDSEETLTTGLLNDFLRLQLDLGARFVVGGHISLSLLYIETFFPVIRKIQVVYRREMAVSGNNTAELLSSKIFWNHKHRDDCTIPAIL